MLIEAATVDIDPFVTHLECSLTGRKFDAGQLHNISAAGAPLMVRYDLEGVRKALTRKKLKERAPDMWRYRELLPVREARHIASLGEQTTPLLRLRTFDAPVFVKDEGRLPTGSFKARGLAVAVAMAKSFGVRRVAIPSAGNAGAAAAAYATRAGIECYVFCPEDASPLNIGEILLGGAKFWKVNGLIGECGRIVADGASDMAWFDLSTLKEPYRVEGKKTMGLELSEQMGWTLPDFIFYPTGGGTGLIAMWKVFAEMEAVGLIGPERPRLVCVQSTGCAPIVRAFEGGNDRAEPWRQTSTIVSGMRVPAAFADFLILRAVRESGGFALAVSDEDVLEARSRIGSDEGLLLCHEGAATVAAYWQARKKKLVGKDQSVVLFNCGNGLKDPLPTSEARIDLGRALDWNVLATA